MLLFFSLLLYSYFYILPLVRFFFLAGVLQLFELIFCLILKSISLLGTIDLMLFLETTLPVNILFFLSKC